jgi:hypothetical protein
MKQDDLLLIGALIAGGVIIYTATKPIKDVLQTTADTFESAGNAVQSDISLLDIPQDVNNLYTFGYDIGETWGQGVKDFFEWVF